MYQIAYSKPAIPIILNSCPCSGNHNSKPPAPTRLSTLNSIAVPQVAQPIPIVANTVPVVLSAAERLLPLVFVVIRRCSVMYWYSKIIFIPNSRTNITIKVDPNGVNIDVNPPNMTRANTPVSISESVAL